MLGAKRFVRTGSVVPGTNLLQIPFAIASAVLILLAATLTLDALASSGQIALPAWLSVGNIDDARAILGAILGAVSTVLALIFSVTLLVFSMAVSQFGPRLMPYFLRVRAMQVAIGLFLATFLHSLITFVVTGQRGNTAFTPQLTVLTSVALVFASFCYLVVHNHRIALAIQTNNVLARIVESLNAAIEAFIQPRVVNTDTIFLVRSQRSQGEESIDSTRRQCMTEGAAIQATTSGYMQRIDRARIANLAERLDAVVCLQFRPGEFVIEGEILAYVLPATKTGELRATIYNAVKIGQHRTLEEDADFAFAQISEIAIRALSPAVNDTYTGLSSIDWLGDSLRLFAALPPLNGAWMTKQGKVRLLVPPLPFARVARTAFEFIRHAAADNPAVCLRLLQTCARLAPQLHNDEQRQAILDQVEAVHEAMARFRHVPLDTDAIEVAYRSARDQLTSV
jgi:uncharacterized membrane protein